MTALVAKNCALTSAKSEQTKRPQDTSFGVATVHCQRINTQKHYCTLQGGPKNPTGLSIALKSASEATLFHQM